MSCEVCDNNRRRADPLAVEVGKPCDICDDTGTDYLGRACPHASGEQPFGARPHQVDGRAPASDVRIGWYPSPTVTSVPDAFAIGSARWNGLGKLVEEAGEVVQVVGKLMATGGDPAGWDGTDLVERLTEELGDLMAALEFVVLMNDQIDSTAVGRRAGKKRALFVAWHDDAAEDGEAPAPAP